MRFFESGATCVQRRKSTRKRQEGARYTCISSRVPWLNKLLGRLYRPTSALHKPFSRRETAVRTRLPTLCAASPPDRCLRFQNRQSRGAIKPRSSDASYFSDYFQPSRNDTFQTSSSIAKSFN